MHSGERGINPVAMTIINPRTEYWPSHGSNQQPPVLKSATLLSELWGMTVEKGENIANHHFSLNVFFYLYFILYHKINPAERTF